MHTNDVISRDRQDKLQIQTTLDNIKNEMNFLERNMETVIPGTASTSVKNQELVNLGKQISDQKSLLASAKKTYGENYPEITRLQAQIDSLEADRAKLQEQDGAATTQGGTPSKTVVNPQAEKQLRDFQSQQKTLQTALANKTLEIEQATLQLTELQKREAAIQRKIDEAPLNEQQYAQMQSEFQLAKGAYEDMVKRQQLSETQQNLEEHKAGENLELLDPANVPEKAVDPNRLAWAGIGTFGGMAFGLMLAAAKEVKNTALKNLKDVRTYSNLPVLSSIPLLENALLVRRKRRLVWLAWSSAVIVGLTLMSGSMYYYMSS
jgi:succinoglycan biosynthesis transport protein ExoP